MFKFLKINPNKKQQLPKDIQILIDKGIIKKVNKEEDKNPQFVASYSR